MSRNFRVEADIKEACQDAGVLESAYDDFCAEYYDFRFDGSPTGIRAHIEQMRKEKPHRFVTQDDQQSRIAIAAFGPSRTLTAQGEYIRRFGTAAAESAAAMFGTTVGSTRPGTIPDHLKTQAAAGDHSRGKDNPWSAVDARGFPTVDARGRFLPAQITKQTNLVRTLVQAHGNVEGTRRAEAIARAAGCTLGATRPPKVA